MKNYFVITNNDKILFEGFMTEEQAIALTSSKEDVIHCFGQSDSLTTTSFILNGDMANEFNSQ